jgi:hypothetical protein
MRVRGRLCVFIMLLMPLPMVVGCGGSSGGGSTPPQPTTYTVGGSDSGLTGTGLVLQNNGGNSLSVSANGAFTFSNSVESGATYSVTVSTQPTDQTCTVTNGGGTATANVTSVQVACSNLPPATYTIGGTVSGLTGTGLVLQDKGGNNLTVSANGTFTFSNSVTGGEAYDVTVLTQPTGQSCTVSNPSGTATANVTNVQVSCSTLPATTYTIGGTVSGLTGAGLVLQDNGGNNLTVSANGPFTFSNSVAGGATYSVTVSTQPTGQRCAVTNGNGTASANVSNVQVTCTTTTVMISVNPSTITIGQSATLTWSSTNATSCTASGAWSGSEAASGSQSVTPTATGTQTYTLSCTGPGGSASNSASLTVNAVGVTISASQTTITVGQSATLTWSSTNATSCTASGAWSGHEGTSGSQSVTPMAAGTQTYSLNCTGPEGSGSNSASLIVDALLSNGTTISPQSTSVKPFEPIIFNVTNPTSGGSYQANLDIGNGTVITVPVIVISSSQLAVTAPAGAYSGTGATLALSSGTVKIALGWTSGSGGYSYSDPISISIAALPTIPSTVQTGAPTIALIKAMKLLYLQGDGKLLADLSNMSSSATGMITAIASQRASIRSTLANLDALQQLISQAATSSSGVSWATIGGVPVTLSSTEVAFLDRLSAGQIQAIEDAAAQSANPSTAQSVRSKTRQRASLAHLPALGRSKGLRTADSSADDSPLDFDATAIAQGLAQNARTIASTMGNVVGVVAGTAAAIAVAAGATASAPALALVAATGFMVSTCLGTGIGATLDVGAEAIAQGSASVSSLTNSAEFFANSYVGLAENTFVSSTVTEAMGPAAGNLAGAIDSAYQIMASSTSPAAQDAENDGYIPDSPTDMPDTFTVDQSATQASTGGGYTVSITTTPATSTNVEVDIESSTGEQEIDVAVTNGSGSFQIPESDSAAPGEDIVIQTMTDNMDDVAGSLDISSVNTNDSDLDSTELPNPDLQDSVQADDGSSDGGGGTTSGSKTSGTITGSYTATYDDVDQVISYSPLTYRQFTDYGTITGTMVDGEVTALTVTSADGLFPGGLSSNPSGGSFTNNTLSLQVYSSDGSTIWTCLGLASSTSGNVDASVDSASLHAVAGGTCTITIQ